jgi:putative PIG3 family NAD(P)H quinone oxidoreductase
MLGRMRAVTVPSPGGPEALTLTELPDPEPGPGEVVLDVVATAVNRADLLQRRGFYPPPPGASDVLGLECSGKVRSVGDGVEGWSPGDEACALLAGGGYAEQVVVPAGQLMRVPAGIPLDVAAALPEVACTVWSNVFMVAHLQPGETLLVHGGAGGIGTFAIQLATALGARVVATAGSEEKLELCRSLGAERAISYRDEDASGAPLWVAALQEAGGADVVLDNMGAKYLTHNVSALAPQGRLVIIGMQGGTKGELDIAALMAKRGAVIATTLRARPVAEKAAICRAVEEHVWPLVESGEVRATVGAELSLADVAEAHALMEAGTHTGKILLRT